MLLGTRPKTHLKRAVLFAVVGAACNAVMGASVKYASDFISTEMIVFARNCICLLLILPCISFSKLALHNWKMHLVRGVAGLTALFLYFYSLKFLPLADATLYFNIYPLLIPFVALAWKKIPIQHNLWGGMGIAFLGLLIILHPGARSFQYASFIAVAAGIAASVNVLAVRFSHYRDPVSHILFFYFFTLTLLSSFLTLVNFEANWTFTLESVKWLLIIGVIGMAWQVCSTFATKYAPARISSIFTYTSVIFSMGIDYFIWHRAITLWMILGFALIVSGAALVVFLHKES